MDRSVGSFAKGIFVDVPLATAEGFRALPKLWGEEAKDNASVKNFSSGTVVAGKSLVLGVSDGVQDAWKVLIAGAREGGFLGATKGVAEGGASLVSKTLSGSIGFLAYPGQGLSRSFFVVTHTFKQKHIVKARRKEGMWLAAYASKS